MSAHMGAESRSSIRARIDFAICPTRGRMQYSGQAISSRWPPTATAIFGSAPMKACSCRAPTAHGPTILQPTAVCRKATSTASSSTPKEKDGYARRKASVSSTRARGLSAQISSLPVSLILHATGRSTKTAATVFISCPRRECRSPPISTFRIWKGWSIPSLPTPTPRD